MKKLFAILLAVSMIMGLALTASAAETTIDDVTIGEWWTYFAPGVEITEEGFTMTLHSTTTAGSTVWYACPSVIIYSSDNAAIWGGNYVEYWIHRGDNWGWCSAGGNSPYGDLNTDAMNADMVAAVANAGITVEQTFAEGFDWNNWLSELLAGVDCTITGKLEGSNAVVSLTVGKITNVVTLPVDTSKPVYLCLTGQETTLTNIKVVTPDAEPETPVEPATGYTAGLSYADADWSFQTWGDAKTSVDGAGTYTLSYDLTADAESAVVLVIDIGDEGGDAADVLGALNLTELKLTADGVEIPVDLTKVAVGNLEGKGRYRIEIYNEYGSTKENSPIDLSLLKASSNVTVTFTLADPNAVQPEPEEPTVTPDPENPKDGDSISVFVALLAVSAVGAAVVLKKKSF